MDRQRRIIVHSDAMLPYELLGIEIDKWLRYRFEYIDSPGTCIDSVFWDMACWDYQITDDPVTEKGKPVIGILKMTDWYDRRIDLLEQLVVETKKRGLEVFWSHRINPIEINALGRLAMDPDSPNPLKVNNPDRVIKTWWWQGLWNLESDAVKKSKTALLRERIERYPFDGIQIDFARNTPCLPPPEQWKKRGHVTEFIRMVRRMLADTEVKKGVPILLAVRIPKHLEGCHTDGFDIETWVDEGLIDVIVTGIRSLHVDIQAFKALTDGTGIRVYPCFDDHHATDGYENMPVEFLRGVFSNWLSQGADGIGTFNWSCASQETHSKYRVTGMSGFSSHGQMYKEARDIRALKKQDRYYSVERRGGFSWGEGFFGTNEDAVLPLDLSNSGNVSCIPIFIFDEPEAESENVEKIELKITLANCFEGDLFYVKLNGCGLNSEGMIDHTWKDLQINSRSLVVPGTGEMDTRREQNLARLTHIVPSGLLRYGENSVELAVCKRMPYFADLITVEKVEVHLTCRKLLT